MNNRRLENPARKRGTDRDRFVGLGELADYSGYSKSYLRRLIDGGDLPAYRIAGRRGAELRVRLRDFDVLMQPVIPSRVYAAMRSRQPGPLHAPLPGGDRRGGAR